MKTVVSSDQVAHLWANQSQSEARNSNGSLYFNGDTIYSYGSHFPIARHVSNKRGEYAVLFTTRDYSSTTAQHKSAVRHALIGQLVFYVEHPTNEGAQSVKANLADYKARIVARLQEAKRARKNATAILANVRDLSGDANAYAAFVGSRARFGEPADFAKLVEEAEGKRKRATEAQRKAEAARKAEEAEHLAQWMRGERDGTFYNSEVRLRAKDDELQTSKGARVPLEDARRAFVLVRRCHDSATSWQRNGETCPVGGFHIDRISENGNVKAGCHVILWDEVERFATAQGWL